MLLVFRHSTNQNLSLFLIIMVTVVKFLNKHPKRQMINLPNHKIIVSTNYTPEEIVERFRMNVFEGKPDIIYFYELQKKYPFYGDFNKNKFSIRKFVNPRNPAPLIKGVFEKKNNNTLISLTFEYPFFQYMVMLVLKGLFVVYHAKKYYNLNEESFFNGDFIFFSATFLIGFLFLFVIIPIIYKVKLNASKKMILSLLKAKK